MKSKFNKTDKIVLAIAGILLLAGCLAVKIYDQHDYDSHMRYAEENNCTWEWNQYGDWTICK